MRRVCCILSLIALCGIAFSTLASRAAEPSSPTQPAVLPSSPAFDFAAIRGANYCSAYGNHDDHWMRYDPKETERDLSYARKIGINQVRVFLSYRAYSADKEKFRTNLKHLAKACEARGIGLMPVVPSTREMVNESAPYPLSRQWVKELLAMIGDEPGLAFWDASNEPDLNARSSSDPSVQHARAMATLFRELDTRTPRTPVTIGFAFEKYMEEHGDVVDVLAYHDYLSTRDAIRKNITAAKAYAAKMHKPLINTEIGCVGRANPYDVCIEEYTRGQVGFYMWELMITGQWGTVHGIFYPDGTVRDPSIAAAMMGIFRNRAEDIVMEQPDREGALSRAITQGRAWLADANGTYAEGIRVAEVAANTLEANELVPMRDPPSRHVLMLQKSEDPAALHALVADFLGKLGAFAVPQNQRNRGPAIVPGSGRTATQPASGGQ